MINPRRLSDAVAAALQSIPDLVSAMNGTENIQAFHYQYGQDRNLTATIADMTAPSILVVWLKAEGGTSGFDGTTLRQHYLEVIIRMDNVANVDDPVAYEDIITMIHNEPVLGGTQSLLYTNLLQNGAGSNQVEIPDTPNMEHRIDENGTDYFIITLVIPEIGENLNG